MSDIEKFISERKARNPKAWASFDTEYQQYAVGALLAEHRKKSGLTLTELARRMKMQKGALSRLENHGEDVQLSTIARYVQATGRPLAIKVLPTRITGRKRRKISAALRLEAV